MVSYEDKWVRIFLVQDTSQHKKGFTLYKVVSMLYPRDCPDAVTKVVVWKRFNDFKKLHRDVKVKCKSLKFKSLHCIAIPKTSYFRRFQENVIEERRNFILNFLNFIAQHGELYTSDAVVNFFKSSYTPSELLSSNISSIRSDLNLPAETEYYTANSDNESEADSISTINSLNSCSVQIDSLPDPVNDDVKNVSSENNSSLTNGTDIYLGDKQDICSSSANSCGSVSSMGNYILEAAQCISNAIQFETEKKYEDAFQEYKTGVDILIKNSKGDHQYLFIYLNQTG
ncbi:ribosomal protein S6 kinase delta-1 [Agrilus planipennis]|uniref:Ribosomal protein S6 kinase delta-1 n=1 Tax=Agrilus planipennis TaxID=224129 RepID=A0A7F5RLA9_AGRPL|nr:ribosomal protein S6 kinase delta-1 [Agrilus planipennis]